MGIFEYMQERCVWKRVMDTIKNQLSFKRMRVAWSVSIRAPYFFSAKGFDDLALA